MAERTGAVREFRVLEDPQDVGGGELHLSQCHLLQYHAQLPQHSLSWAKASPQRGTPLKAQHSQA